LAKTRIIQKQLESDIEDEKALMEFWRIYDTDADKFNEAQEKCNGMKTQLEMLRQEVARLEGQIADSSRSQNALNKSSGSGRAMDGLGGSSQLAHSMPNANSDGKGLQQKGINAFVHEKVVRYLQKIKKELDKKEKERAILAKQLLAFKNQEEREQRDPRFKVLREPHQKLLQELANVDKRLEFLKKQESTAEEKLKRPII
jgi:predicted  nucleic acid-binding Zn-ribbon protein